MLYRQIYQHLELYIGIYRWGKAGRYDQISFSTYSRKSVIWTRQGVQITEFIIALQWILHTQNALMRMCPPLLYAVVNSRLWCVELQRYARQRPAAFHQIADLKLHALQNVTVAYLFLELLTTLYTPQPVTHSFWMVEGVWWVVDWVWWWVDNCLGWAVHLTWHNTDITRQTVATHKLTLTYTKPVTHSFWMVEGVWWVEEWVCLGWTVHLTWHNNDITTLTVATHILTLTYTKSVTHSFWMVEGRSGVWCVGCLGWTVHLTWHSTDITTHTVATHILTLTYTKSVNYWLVAGVCRVKYCLRWALHLTWHNTDITTRLIIRHISGNLSLYTAATHLVAAVGSSLIDR